METKQIQLKQFETFLTVYINQGNSINKLFWKPLTLCDELIDIL